MSHQLKGKCNFFARFLARAHFVLSSIVRSGNTAQIICYFKPNQYRVVVEFVWLILVMANLNTLGSTNCCLYCIQKVWRKLTKQRNLLIQCNCRLWVSHPTGESLSTLEKFRKRFWRLLVRNRHTSQLLKAKRLNDGTLDSQVNIKIFQVRVC